jgi:adenine-specific DNA-methyltransferase
LVYAKNRRKENRRLKESNKDSWYSSDDFVCKPLPLDKSKFSNPDNDPRGIWKADPFDAPGIRTNLSYPIVNPVTGESHYPPKGRHWRMERSLFEKALADDRIVWGATGVGRPQLKVFYEEKKFFGSVDNTWFSADRVGTATNGTKELMQLFDGAKYFETPKPISLISKLLELANLSKEAIVMDFFSGSATTAHAVMQMNCLDGGKRKYIMVQLPEKTNEGSEAQKNGLLTICDIGKERIRRAGKQIRSDQNIFSDAELDIGFRVLKLADSNMESTYYTPAKLDQKSLFSSVENVKPDRTAGDLLFQVMPECGCLFSDPVEKIKVGSKDVYRVNHGQLMACFEPELDEDVIVEIAKQKPVYFVTRDSSIAKDQVLDNFDQLFKSYSPLTKLRII